MRYLTVDDVVRINEGLLGPDRLADFGLLESAVNRPQASAGGQDAYADLHNKAAALLHSLARNHAFLDGNKRTALVAVTAFYAMNRWELDLEQGDAVDLLTEAAEGLLDVSDIAAVLKDAARQMPDMDPDLEA